MSELEKTYDSSLVEKKLYAFWEESGFFKANANSSKDPFCVILPPPNVTGVLHMGHALVNTLQDVLVRYKRMCGYEALWIPGTDHAGISTQTIVERHLHATTGKHKCDFTREEFLKHVWKWKNDHEEIILNQLRKLGCSLDWSRLRFTMDEKSTLAVQTMFKKMYDDNLIYQGDYLVNWDPVIETAIADDEVEHEEIDSCLWYISYPIDNEPLTILIATTRPETILGDTAVAVSPNDERYSHLIGKYVRLPISERLIPIISDHYVDPKFGSGAVKITPAHDFNDYEIGLRHNLPMINIMNQNGTINENGGEFKGLKMAQARKAVIKQLKALSLLKKIEPHRYRVGISYRSKAIIEPYLSKQWFIKMKPFKEKLISVIKDKKIIVIPDGWERVYFNWIENLRDWCISRQLWWGHRIPIWYNTTDKTKIICSIGENPPKEVEENPTQWIQDCDVLDTWFSSALWPLTTLGWPELTDDFKKFYPTSTLITGHDILFFWVARMILMGEYASGKEPFNNIFLHGLIYGKSYWKVSDNGDVTYLTSKERFEHENSATPNDKVKSKWEKMSKSKGNVIDPIEIIDEYGADAMRFALCSSATHSRQIDLDKRRFAECKHFANKIWNATRFILLNLDDEFKEEDIAKGVESILFTLDDKWILSRLNTVVDSIHKKFKQYEFNDAAKESYEFFWDEFCAYYIECCKPYLSNKIEGKKLVKNKQQLLVIILLASIRLMHPIAPFITEEIFLFLKKRFPNLTTNRQNLDPYTNDTLKALNAKSCTIANFPNLFNRSDINISVEDKFNYFKNIVHAIRQIRSDMRILQNTPTDLYIISENEDKLNFITSNKIIITSLVKTNTIFSLSSIPKFITSSSNAIIDDIQIIIPLPKELKDEEKKRLAKEIEKQHKQIDSLQLKLNNEHFLKKAPQELVEQTKLTLKQAQVNLNELLILHKIR